MSRRTFCIDNGSGEEAPECGEERRCGPRDSKQVKDVAAALSKVERAATAARTVIFTVDQ
ncbi:hypothetical protein KA183_14620 [bacterium]|nr:hypothetical protein [bacterium]